MPGSDGIGSIPMGMTKKFTEKLAEKWAEWTLSAGAASMAAICWTWLWTPHEWLGVELWGIRWVAIALAIPTIPYLVVRCVRWLRRPKLDWRQFTSMHWRGMEWTWTWDPAQKYAASKASLRPFCSTCGEHITIEETPVDAMRSRASVRFHCPGTCACDVAQERSGTKDMMLEAVIGNIASRCRRMEEGKRYKTYDEAKQDDPEKTSASVAQEAKPPASRLPIVRSAARTAKPVRVMTAEQARAEGYDLPAGPAPKTSEQLTEEMVDADREERDRLDEATAIKKAAKRRSDMVDERLCQHLAMVVAEQQATAAQRGAAAEVDRVDAEQEPEPSGKAEAIRGTTPSLTVPDRVRFMGLAWENSQPHCPRCGVRLQPVMVGGGKSQLMNGCPNCKNPLTEPSAHAIEDMRERLLEQRLRQLGRDPAIRDASTFTDPTAGAPAQATGSDIDVHLPVDPDPMVAHGQSQRQKALAAHIMERHFPHLTDRRKVAQVDILRTCTDARWTLEEAKTALALLVETGRLARSGTKGGIRYHSAHNAVDWRTEFHGMRWRGVDWTWRVSASGDPGDIKVTCPVCSTPMYPTNSSGYDAVPLIVLTCDHCRQHFGPPFNGDGDALLLRMQAEMQRRINVCEKGGYADAKAMADDDHEPIDYAKVTTAREIAAATTGQVQPEMPVLAGDQLVHAKQVAQAFQAHDLLIRVFGGKPAFTILTTVEIREKLQGTGRNEEAIAASLQHLRDEGLVTILDRFSCTQVIPTEAGQKLVDDRLGVPESVREAARAARMAAYRVGEQPPAKVKPDASEPALTREILLHAFEGGNLGRPVFKDAAIAVMKTVGYEAPDVERTLSLMEAKNLLSSVTSASNGTTQYSLTTAGEKRAKAGT